MGREYYFKPGSYYRICDRSGFRFRAERTKKEWQGLIVADRFWEPRNAQDYVRGVRDDQTVPEARPRPTVQYIGLAQTTLSAFAPEGSEYIFVNSPFSYAIGDTIGITLNFDLGIVFYCEIVSSNGADPVGALVLSEPLPGPANSGNWVVNASSPQITPQSYGSSSGG